MAQARLHSVMMRLLASSSKGKVTRLINAITPIMLDSSCLDKKEMCVKIMTEFLVGFSRNPLMLSPDRFFDKVESIELPDITINELKEVEACEYDYLLEDDDIDDAVLIERSRSSVYVPQTIVTCDIQFERCVSLSKKGLLLENYKRALGKVVCESIHDEYPIENQAQEVAYILIAEGEMTEKLQLLEQQLSTSEVYRHAHVFAQIRDMLLFENNLPASGTEVTVDPAAYLTALTEEEETEVTVDPAAYLTALTEEEETVNPAAYLTALTEEEETEVTVVPAAYLTVLTEEEETAEKLLLKKVEKLLKKNMKKDAEKDAQEDVQEKKLKKLRSD